MPSTQKMVTLITYIVVVVVLLVAFGFTLTYLFGDQIHLPFTL